jgi:hypothetical protein
MAKNGFSMSNRVAVEDITASKTLTVDDCGKNFVVTTAGAAVTVTLPTLASAGTGWNATFFVVSGSSAGNVKVTSQAADLYFRGIITGADAGGSANTTALTSIQLGSATVKTGDQIEVVAGEDQWQAIVWASGTITPA